MASKAIDRRDFVVASAVVGAGILITGISGCTSDDSPETETATPSTTYGKESAMSKRILVGYATKNGSTVGVAEKMGQTLAAQGHVADVKPLAERPSLDGYHAVVLGSAINGAHWLPEAVDFVRSNQTKLASMPVATFCVHAMNCGTDANETAKRLAYLDEVRALIRPSAEGFFAGKGPTSKDTFWLALWAFRKFGGHVVEGDGRDWDKIAGWTRDLAV